ncbi:GAF domain-containing protein [Cohnella sp. REN36]|uniref:GAF domain-containing protein n=1 Tax=Cohnella sp. REN36 TaxID=2887347 RepID=UPI001D1349B6|nr:GAF domain-containing protein [Cohnella sp. REN36]MCC3373562.1 GAF domain-containing protein [Cohnella sp. REN36]
MTFLVPQATLEIEFDRTEEKEGMTMSLEHEWEQEMKLLLSDLGCDFCSVGILDTKSRILTWKLAVGNMSDRYQQISEKPGRGFHKSVIKIGRAMAFQMAELVANRQMQEYPILMSEHLRSAYAVPIMEGHQVVGVLLIGNRSNRVFQPEDRIRAASAGECVAESLAAMRS